MALNGGLMFTFSPPISFLVTCTTQQKVDELRDKLSASGENELYGWRKDKYGVAWQSVPTVLDELLIDHDPAKLKRMIETMRVMKIIDIEKLKPAMSKHRVVGSDRRNQK